MLSKSQSVGRLHAGSVASATSTLGPLWVPHVATGYDGNPIKSGPERGLHSAPYLTPVSLHVTVLPFPPAASLFPLQPPSHQLELLDLGRVYRTMGRPGWHVLGFEWLPVPFPLLSSLCPSWTYIPIPDTVNKVPGQWESFLKKPEIRAMMRRNERRGDPLLYWEPLIPCRLRTVRRMAAAISVLLLHLLILILHYLYTSRPNKQRCRDLEVCLRPHS